MAGRSAYAEGDRARVYAVLLSNSGNVKRTARDTGIPEQTVRRWKGEFEENPPAQDLVAPIAADIVKDMDRVRRMALSEMERKILGGEAKLAELNTVFGTLTDKMNILDGLATSRVDHTLTLPSADEIRAVLLPAIQASIDAAAERQQDIIDADVVEVSESRQLSA